jgi:hypothetical protein
LEQLAAHYQSLLFVYRHATVMPKVAILAVLYLVATGNRYPGFQFITAVMALQLLVSGILSMGAGWGPGVVALSAIAACLALLPLLMHPEVEWTVLPGSDSAWHWPAWLAIGGAILFPFLGDRPSFWNTVVYAPMAVIPHGTISLALILATQSPNPRVTTAGWVFAAAGLLIAGVDLLGGFVLSPLFIVGCVGAFVTSRILPRIPSQAAVRDSDSAEEIPSVVKERGSRKQSRGGRKWDL